MAKITNDQKYEYILSRIQEQLEKDGYKRSGKSSMFYRYHADKQVACVLGMQKSVNNCYDFLNFTFNVGCVTIDEIVDVDSTFFGSSLNLAILKEYLRSVLSERIGHICRGGDVWYELSEYSLMGRGLSQYYDDTIRPDVEKVMLHLNELSHKKQLQYFKQKG